MILYLYKQVLAIDLPWLDEMVQARRLRCLPVPVVLTPARVHVDEAHGGTMELTAQLLY